MDDEGDDALFGAAAAAATPEALSEDEDDNMEVLQHGLLQKICT